MDEEKTVTAVPYEHIEDISHYNHNYYRIKENDFGANCFLGISDDDNLTDYYFGKITDKNEFTHLGKYFYASVVDDEMEMARHSVYDTSDLDIKEHGCTF